MVISAFSSPISCRSEVTFAAYGWGSRSPSSHAVPQAPNRSEQVTASPSLASTAWTWSLHEVRRPTSFCRYLVSSRRSPISAGGPPCLVETDACNFQHPPEAEARFFMASGLSYGLRAFISCNLTPFHCSASTLVFRPPAWPTAMQPGPRAHDTADSAPPRIGVRSGAQCRPFQSSAI